MIGVDFVCRYGFGQICFNKIAYFVVVDGLHKPICGPCLVKLRAQTPLGAVGKVQPLENIDPELVPPFAMGGQPQPSPLGPSDPTDTPGCPATPSRPPLKAAFAELAVSLLHLGVQKVEEWKKR
jgi:hypothetical protein